MSDPAGLAANAQETVWKCPADLCCVRACLPTERAVDKMSLEEVDRAIAAAHRPIRLRLQHAAKLFKSDFRQSASPPPSSSLFTV